MAIGACVTVEIVFALELGCDLAGAANTALAGLAGGVILTKTCGRKIGVGWIDATLCNAEFAVGTVAILRAGVGAHLRSATAD